ncbi:hypothetical protein [Sphingobium cupriresistens]|uniref:hypothetical protein n=1 Tax=Sphingobium cupriresistens TaxID=1132417 RepID=UPI003BADC367
MTIEVTPHGRRPQDRTSPVTAIGAQVGAMFAVANGAVSAAATRPGLYRIVALDDCRVRAGAAGLVNAGGGARMYAGSVETWFLETGQVIACDALA